MQTRTINTLERGTTSPIFYSLNNIKTYQKMEDLLIFRRQRGTCGQWKSHEKPRIKIEITIFT